MAIRRDLRLDMIGIPLGAKITLIDRPDIECIVVSQNPPELAYEDSVYLMTTLVRKVLDIPSHIAPQPTQWLVYEGKTFAELRDEFEEYHTHHLK